MDRHADSLITILELKKTLTKLKLKVEMMLILAEYWSNWFCGCSNHMSHLTAVHSSDSTQDPEEEIVLENPENAPPAEWVFSNSIYLYWVKKQEPLRQDKRQKHREY